MKNVLITSASGHIGQRLVPLLLSHASAPSLVLPTSNAAKLSKSISAKGPSKVTVTDNGALNDPGYIQDLLIEHDIDTIFLNLTGMDELFTTNAFLSAVSKSGCVKHLVYLSACGDFRPEQHSPGVGGGAHVAVKLITEQMLRQLYPSCSSSKFTWTILGPTLFTDNDQRERPSVMGEKGMFMEPLGRIGCSRIVVEDIAYGVLRSMEDGGKKWGGKKVMLGTKKMYTDNDMVKLWSEALKKDVKVNADLDLLEQHCKQHLGPTWARDLRMMFDIFQEHGFGMTDSEYTDQVEFLGREPTAYEEHVKEVAGQWAASKYGQYK